MILYLSGVVLCMAFLKRKIARWKVRKRGKMAIRETIPRVKTLRSIIRAGVSRKNTAVLRTAMGSVKIIIRGLKEIRRKAKSRGDIEKLEETNELIDEWMWQIENIDERIRKIQKEKAEQN